MPNDAPPYRLSPGPAIRWPDLPPFCPLLLLDDTMILTIAYAKRLIKSGKATIVATVTHDGGEYYVINRHDLQRTDHAEVSQ